MQRTILELRNEMPANIAKTVSESVVKEVRVVISIVAEQIAGTMTDKLLLATAQANIAANSYKEMAQSARLATANTFKQAMYTAVVISLVVSVIVSLLIVYFIR